MRPPRAAGPKRWTTGRRLLVTLILTVALFAGLGVLVILLAPRGQAPSPDTERSAPRVRQVIPDGPDGRDNPSRH